MRHKNGRSRDIYSARGWGSTRVNFLISIIVGPRRRGRAFVGPVMRFNKLIRHMNGRRRAIMRIDKILRPSVGRDLSPPPPIYRPSGAPPHTQINLLTRCANFSESSPLRGSQKSLGYLRAVRRRRTARRYPITGVPPEAAKKTCTSGLLKLIIVPGGKTRIILGGV
jgi:hypothetical protein